MSDDRWRRDGRGEDPEASEFGGPLFPDDPADAASGGIGRPDSSPDSEERRLRFGPDDTGPLPHWTDPPTGEIPRLDPRGGVPDEESDEVDVWSTFTTESPVWRDDVDENMVTGVIEQVPSEFRPPTGNASGAVPRTGRDASGGVEQAVFDRGSDYDPTGGYDRDASGSSGRVSRDPSSSGGVDRTGDPSGSLFGDYGSSAYGSGREPSGSVPRTAERGNLTGEVPLPPRREPGRITIGTDPSGMPRRSPDPRGRRPGAPRGAGGRPIGPTRKSAPPSQRDMTTAIVVALVLAGVFIAALIISPAFTLVIVAVVMALAGWEYFGKVSEKGYRPAVAVGLAACLFAPIAAYFYGAVALPLVMVLAFMTAAIGFITTPGVESGPLPNMAVTTLGVMWIGILGSFAGLILRLSTGVTVVGDLQLFGIGNLGTDTMFMIALGVAANDIGALMVGSAFGKTPLRAWVSPSKTIEGLLGGTVATFFSLFIASKIVNDQNAWSQNKWILLLALTISVLAPLGDLTESMFKRNLEIKDFGTIVQGHGGVLDRFDGFLFVLPGVYYLTLLLIATS